MSRQARPVLGALVLVIGLGALGRAQTEEDEKVLRALKVAVDGPGLLEFFRSQTLTSADRERLEGLASALADQNFRTREKAAAALVAAGPKALPALREAVKGPDLEARRRAQRCMELIEQRSSSDSLTAAARLLPARRPAGAAAVLLDYLPSARDEQVEEAVLAALWSLTAGSGKAEPAVVAALADKAAARRGASALLLGRFGDDSQRAAVHAVLTEDRSPLVRLRAAQGLLAGRDPAAVPALLQMLGHGPYEFAQQAEDLLGRVAAKDAPAVPLGEEGEARAKSHAAWDGWWRTHKDRLDLKRAELDLPLASPSWQARGAALRFLNRLAGGDLDGVCKEVGVPFSVDGVMVLKTEEEFRGIFQRAVAEQEKQKLTFSVFRTVTPDVYAKGVKAPQMRDFLKSMPAAESYVLYIRSSDTTPGADNLGALLVRLQGGRPKVVGLGQLTKGQAGQ